MWRCAWGAVYRAGAEAPAPGGRGGKFKDTVGGGEAEGVSRGVSEGQDHSSSGKSGPRGPLMAPREYFREGWVKA